ncbi:transcription factor 2 [Ilyonectria robusta]
MSSDGSISGRHQFHSSHQPSAVSAVFIDTSGLLQPLDSIPLTVASHFGNLDPLVAGLRLSDQSAHLPLASQAHIAQPIGPFPPHPVLTPLASLEHPFHSFLSVPVQDMGFVTNQGSQTMDDFNNVTDINSPLANSLDGSATTGTESALLSGHCTDNPRLVGKIKKRRTATSSFWRGLKTKAGKDRKRLPLACISCRRKKIRCSGEEPTCKHCSRLRIPCEYKVNTRKSAQRPIL